VAEDYARVARDALNAVQVKDTAGSGSITLNTAHVRDAITAFVGLVAKNPGRRVTLHYLTTSSIGTEQKIVDRPAGEAGLAYWRRAAAMTDVEPLRAVLMKGGFARRSSRLSTRGITSSFAAIFSGISIGIARGRTLLVSYANLRNG